MAGFLFPLVLSSFLLRYRLLRVARIMLTLCFNFKVRWLWSGRWNLCDRKKDERETILWIQSSKKPCTNKASSSRAAGFTFTVCQLSVHESGVSRAPGARSPWHQPFLRYLPCSSGSTSRRTCLCTHVWASHPKRQKEREYFWPCPAFLDNWMPACW